VTEPETLALKQLIRDLQVLEKQKDDLETRIAGVRELITEVVKPLGEPVNILNRRIRWHEPTTIERLDRGKLVQAGVTQEQLDKGTVLSPKKGYLDIRTIREWTPQNSHPEQGA
jgi:hypothetical protein